MPAFTIRVQLLQFTLLHKDHVRKQEEMAFSYVEVLVFVHLEWPYKESVDLKIVHGPESSFVQKQR